MALSFPLVVLETVFSECAVLVVLPLVCRCCHSVPPSATTTPTTSTATMPLEPKTTGRRFGSGMRCLAPAPRYMAVHRPPIQAEHCRISHMSRLAGHQALRVLLWFVGLARRHGSACSCNQEQCTVAGSSRLLNLLLGAQVLRQHAAA